MGEHGRARRRRARVVVPLEHVERARCSGQERVARRSRRTRPRTQPTSPAGMRSALPPSACATSCAPRQVPSTGSAARVHVGDHLALALERRVAVGAVRVDDAAEHDQPVERPGRRLRLRERVPGDGADAERRERRLERRRAACRDRAGRRAPWDSRLTPHFRPSARRRRRLAKVRAMRASVLLAMGLLYIVWGSTYLAIRVTRRDDAGARLVRRALPARRRARAQRAGGARAARPAAGLDARSAAPPWPVPGSSSAASASSRSPRRTRPPTSRPCWPRRPRCGSSATARSAASASAAARSAAR